MPLWLPPFTLPQRTAVQGGCVSQTLSLAIRKNIYGSHAKGQGKLPGNLTSLSFVHKGLTRRPNPPTLTRNGRFVSLGTDMEIADLCVPEAEREKVSSLLSLVREGGKSISPFTSCHRPICRVNCRSAGSAPVRERAAQGSGCTPPTRLWGPVLHPATLRGSWRLRTDGGALDILSKVSFSSPEQPASLLAILGEGEFLTQEIVPALETVHGGEGAETDLIWGIFLCKVRGSRNQELGNYRTS